MPSSKERMRTAQEFKQSAISGKNIVMPYELASLAFGITEKDLGNLFVMGECLVIKPLINTVELSLEDSALDWQKDLWQEMLSSLEKGRSQFNIPTYEFLYLMTQMSVRSQRVPKKWVESIKLPPILKEMESFKLFWEDVQRGKSDLEGYDRYLQGLLCVYWSMLPQSIQEEHRNIAPELVMQSITI